AFLRALETLSAQVHAIEVDGAPILRIHRFDAGPGREALARLWERRKTAQAAWQRLVRWLGTDRTRLEPFVTILAERRERGHADPLARLQALRPPEVGGGIESVLLDLEAKD